MEITRETFCKLFEKYNLDDLFYEVVNGNKFTELPNFLIYLDYEMEQVTIINRDCLEAISWYKYMHPGRCLEVVGIETKDELKDFLKQLANDCKEKLNAN